MDVQPSFIIDKCNKNRINNTITIKGMVLVGVDLSEERITKGNLSYQRKEVY